MLLLAYVLHRETCKSLTWGATAWKHAENIAKKMGTENRSCKSCKHIGTIQMTYALVFALGWSWIDLILYKLVNASLRSSCLTCLTYFAVLIDHSSIGAIDFFSWTSFRDCPWKFERDSPRDVSEALLRKAMENVVMIEDCSDLHQSWYMCTKYHFRIH